MLAGAVNTAIVGSNGVLNRVSEDGVLTDWFRKPHQRFGTTYRLINLIVDPAARHDPAQPRQRLRARRGLRVRRRLELRVQRAGGAGPALQAAGRAARVEGAAQPARSAAARSRSGWSADRGRRCSPARSSTCSPRRSRRSPASLFTRRLLRRVRRLRADRRAATARGARACSISSSSTPEQEIGTEALGCRPGGVLVPVRDYNTLAQLDWVLGEHGHRRSATSSC